MILSPSTLSANALASAATSVETKSTAVAPTAPDTPPAAAVVPASPPQAAAPAQPPKPAITLLARIDLGTQTASISTNGQPLHTWKISSGTEEFQTPRGTFRPEWMAKMWFSKKYDDAPMPHAVFFKDGAAIHATQATHALGRPASHGCVRLAPKNAETFYGLVQKHGIAHTRIEVFGTPKFAPHVAKATAPRQPGTQPGAIAYTPPSRYGSSTPVIYAQNQGQNQGFFGTNPYRYPGDPAPAYRYGARTR